MVLPSNSNLILNNALKVQIEFIGTRKNILIRPGFKKFIQEIIYEENKKLGEIHIIFTDNKNILEINQRFLKHHYYTDVITFADNRKDTLSGDVYISIDQVITNSKTFSVSFIEELGRVIIHGVLHLIGYGDKMEKEKIIMRKKEDDYLWRLKKYDLIAEREIEL